MGETAPFWGFSAASYPDLEGQSTDSEVIRDVKPLLNGDANTYTKVCTFYFYLDGFAWYSLSMPLLVCSSTGSHLSPLMVGFHNYIPT